MPIQNVGTLLEHLVITEAARTLAEACQRQGTPLEFLNAFAMPPRTRWLANSQNAGFDDAVLDKVRDVDAPRSYADSSYPYILRANLRADRGQGPNAALLVLGVSGETGCACRMWLNDIRDGHYGDAIPDLQHIHAFAAETYGTKSISASRLDVRVSDTNYPAAIANLRDTLKSWSELARAGARLGFLDPMRYRIAGRKGAETSSEDHRSWLAQLAFDGPTLAVHFTGHSDHATLEAELRSLHEDALAEGYQASRCFKRQHYAVFCASRGALPQQGEAMAADMEVRVRVAWNFWCGTFTALKNRGLTIYHNGTTR